MSIPDRLWRVVKGYWDLAEDRVREADAQASAYQELADVLRTHRAPAEPSAPGTALPSGGAGGGTVASGSRPASAALPAGPGEGHDPLEAAYELLDVEPGVSVAGLEQALDRRLAQIRPEQYPAGSPERAALEAKRSAVQAAYEHVRDLINPTETRFERLEF